MASDILVMFFALATPERLTARSDNDDDGLAEEDADLGLASTAFRCFC